MNETKINTINFKIDIRKIFTDKIKSSLNNLNSIQIMKIIKRNKNNKNSQTMIKKYDYDFNKTIKSNSTELKNSFNSIKNIKNYYYSIKNNKHIKNSFNNNKMNSAKNKKLFNSVKTKDNKMKLFVYNHNKIKLKKMHKKKYMSQKNFFTMHQNLEKINIKNTNYININSIDNYESKNNNLTSDINIIEKNRIKNSKSFSQVYSIPKNLYYKKHNNNEEILFRNNSINRSKEKSRIIWTNNILSSIIDNIIKYNKNINEEKFNNYIHHRKIKISTILDLYNKNKKSRKYN